MQCLKLLWQNELRCQKSLVCKETSRRPPLVSHLLIQRLHGSTREYLVNQLRPQPPQPCQSLTAIHYGWLALAIFLLTIYGSLIPLQFQPRPLPEALAAFSQIAFFDPSDLGARGDWVVSVFLFA